MAFQTEKYLSLTQDLLKTKTNLVAVSKTKPIQDLEEAYAAGVRDFGENYVQELIQKEALLPKDIHWHFIGHLQSNKIKIIAPFVYLIHGVDSEKLLIEINKQGQKINRKIKCLLQIYIAKEETKFGLDQNELNEILQKYLLPNSSPLEFVEICGLMGMASFTTENNIVDKEFNQLHQIFNETKHKLKYSSTFNILSMGMSNDYVVAIKNGSNLIRIGSALFGER